MKNSNSLDFDAMSVGITNLVASLLARSGNIDLLVRNIPKILLAILVKHYLAETATIVALGSSLSWSCASLLYSRKSFNGRDRLESKIITELNEVIGSSCSINMFPIFVTMKGYQCDLVYFKPVHGRYVDELIIRVTESYNQEQEHNGPKSMYFNYTNNYRPATYSTMFPSRNYLRLETIVKKHLNACDLTRNYRVLGLLIDGQSGLGKSSFADYAVSQGLVPSVYRANLSYHLCLSIEPDIIFQRIFFDTISDHPSIYLIDDIDGYIDYHIEISYQKLSHPKVSKRDHAIRVKTDFLYLLLSILELSGLSTSCIVIFCCNNFDKIFEDVDMTHIRSIYNRFVRVKFEEVDCGELINYLKFYNEMFRGSEIYVEEDELKEIVSKIPQNVSLTYRQLGQISMVALYNPENIVERILELDSEKVDVKVEVTSHEDEIEVDVEEVKKIEEKDAKKIKTKKKLDVHQKSPMELHSGLLPDEIDPSKLVEIYECYSCTFTTISRKNLCSCRACLEGEYTRGSNGQIEIMCHYCRTGETYEDYIPPYLESDWKEKSNNLHNIIGKMENMAEMVDTTDQDRKLIYVSLFDFMSKDQNMSLINSPNMRGVRFNSIIMEIRAFTCRERPFVSANAAFFETLLRKVRLDSTVNDETLVF